MGKFVYRKRTVAEVERHIQGENTSRDYLIKEGFSFFIPKDEGKYRVRVLPQTWDGDPVDFGIPFYAHYRIGGSGMFLSRSRMFQIPCVQAAHPNLTPEDPIREEIDRLMSVKDKEAAEAMYAGRSFLVWIIDREDEGKGPQLWRMPYKKIAKQIGTISIEEREQGDGSTIDDVIHFDDPDSGYDLHFVRSGQGRYNTDYDGVRLARNPTPLSTDKSVQNKWMDYIIDNPLPTVLNFPPVDKIRAVLGTRVIKEDAAEEETSGEKRFSDARKAADDDKEESPDPIDRAKAEVAADKPARRSRPGQ